MMKHLLLSIFAFFLLAISLTHGLYDFYSDVDPWDLRDLHQPQKRLHNLALLHKNFIRNALLLPGKQRRYASNNLAGKFQR
uniref:Uncharacterized protein n=1 Tax=Acrobeloides nanus TaxID=290746 RepID=A0A914C818_9BILA